ncbi:MAG: hypothetical protein KDA75_15520, partial [Planctomycetaceae bacterium]|nr:hypothetical protein [Planctomycetaceae bacterium]
MRMPSAKTALAGVLTLLTAVTSASAQTGRVSLGPADLGQPQWANAPSGGAFVPGPGPGGPTGVPGAMFQPQYGTMPPQALYPPQAPNTMNPWPEVSPFHPPNVKYTQHTNKKNGLWYKEAVHRKTDYEFGIEYILTSFEQPKDRLVGSNFQPLITQQDGDLIGQGPVIYTYGLAQTPSPNTASFVFPGANPFPFILQNDLATRVAIEDGTLFPIHTLGALEGGLDSNGIKLRWGMMNEDGTGWSASGFFAPETTMQFQRGTDNVFGVPITQTMLVASSGFPSEMSALIFARIGGLPLIYSDDLYAFDHVGGFLGETQKFDLLYRLQYDTSAAGTDLNRYTGILKKTDNMKVTSFVGARYFHLAENFSFRGLDSGLGYDFGDDPDDPEFLRPDNTSIVVDYPLLDARLNSAVESHMAGAQAGFRVDIGHKGAFHVWTQTTGGLLGNYETLEVNGNNIGVASIGARPDMHDGLPSDPPIPNGQFLDNSFRDKERHTHVSPLFEQSLYADIRLRSILPFLKKSYLLEEAQFRVGYTFTWIGGVSRPGDSINWVGFPRFPSV